MNILQICNKFPYPLKDGGAIAIHTMTKSFYLLHHNITVATINTSKHYTDILEVPDHITSMADYHSVNLNTKITPWGLVYNLLFSSKPYTATRFIAKEFEQELCDILLSKQFDIVHIEGLYMLPYIPIIRKYSQAIIGYRAHNVEYKIWERVAHETKMIGKKWYLQTLARRIKKFEIQHLNLYDVLIPITQIDADNYNALGNKKPYFVAPTGVFTETLKPAVSPPSIQSIFHIGGLDWVPNQQGLLWFVHNCFPRIRKEFPHIEFVVAGRNAPQSFIKKMSADGVRFEGEVEDAKDFMEQQGIMAVPLLAGSGMRIKIIEGLALGKAIVSTSIGAEGIHAPHKEAILIADSAEDFAQAIIELIKNNDLRTTIEKNAVTFVASHFDNVSIILELLNFYKKYAAIV